MWIPRPVLRVSPKRSGWDQRDDDERLHGGPPRAASDPYQSRQTCRVQRPSRRDASTQRGSTWKRFHHACIMLQSAMHLATKLELTDRHPWSS